MAAGFDDSDFVERDFPTRTLASARPPSRSELDAKVVDAQQKLAELRRAQEELERERAVVEESRRRFAEYQAGREEMLQDLTRGLGLIEESELAARRDAEQMARSITGLRDALEKVKSLQDSNWTQENWKIELTRALTTLENARMEWNGARLKWPVLTQTPVATQPEEQTTAPLLAGAGFWQLCRCGMALTWPLALLGLLILLVLLFRR
jgi:predicted nuclease with TOPRIM domain